MFISDLSLTHAIRRFAGFKPWIREHFNLTEPQFEALLAARPHLARHLDAARQSDRIVQVTEARANWLAANGDEELVKLRAQEAERQAAQARRALPAPANDS